MLRIYTELEKGAAWVKRYRHRSPTFACILGFTQTGLIEGISAAGTTPEHRRYTAIADAEFLYNGPDIKAEYPLPPLIAGASPVLISRALLTAYNIPFYIFNAGLPQAPPVPNIDLQGTPARCLSTGNALDQTTVEHLLNQGLYWGEKLGNSNGYLILGECVVGGTTTALAILSGLGFSASGKVSSSHPTCNHAQKWTLVQTGLQKAGFWPPGSSGPQGTNNAPLQLVAAVGDPMQIVAAGMAIAASRRGGVLLAGGTQMLAVYALLREIACRYSLDWCADEIVVGTTRWVAEDKTGDAPGLAQAVGSVPFLAAQLNFSSSRFSALRAYEQGYVKEGMGAGGCAIAAYLYQDTELNQILPIIEALVERCS